MKFFVALFPENVKKTIFSISFSYAIDQSTFWRVGSIKIRTKIRHTS